MLGVLLVFFGVCFWFFDKWKWLSRENPYFQHRKNKISSSHVASKLELVETEVKLFLSNKKCLNIFNEKIKKCKNSENEKNDVCKLWVVQGAWNGCQLLHQEPGGHHGWRFTAGDKFC